MSSYSGGNGMESVARVGTDVKAAIQWRKKDQNT